MNERLQQFLSAENLTPAKLADILGVQRSGLSHILSGRNYPSYEFIRTILSKFPNLSADWLLLGKGKMYKDAGSPTPVPAPAVPTAPAAVVQAPLINPVEDDPSLFDQPEASASMPLSSQPSTPQSTTKSSPIPVIDPESEERDSPAFEQERDLIPDTPAGKKQIVRITIFYADGSYEEH